MRERALRGALTLLALSSGFVGTWATFLPRSFFDDFPGSGRGWVSLDGPYNEHLVRDVGELSLALTILAVAAAVLLGRPLVRTTALAFLADGALHLAYHLRHLHAFPPGERVVAVASLLVAPVAALAALWLARPAAGRGVTVPGSRPPSRSSPSGVSAGTAGR